MLIVVVDIVALLHSIYHSPYNESNGKTKKTGGLDSDIDQVNTYTVHITAYMINQTVKRKPTAQARIYTR
jgi:exo-beta-1,3-glucanase (GH17 family)